MRFTSILSSALLATTALAAPPSVSKSNTDTDSIPSIAQAKAHGVDPYGPIPNGATKYEDGSYSAEPNTPAWFWIVAQIDIGIVLKKRQEPGANLGVALFAEPGCIGQVYFVPYVVFDRPYMGPGPIPIPTLSLATTFRDLIAPETLLLSPPLECGRPAAVIPPHTGIRCHNTPPSGCFRLTRA